MQSFTRILRQHGRQKVFFCLRNVIRHNYTTFVNIQEETQSLNEMANHIWSLSNNMNEVNERFHKVRDYYVYLLDIWDLRLKRTSTEADNKNRNIPSLQKYYYKKCIEFMLFLELYSYFLESFSNVRNVNENVPMENQFSSEQLALFQNSFLQRNAVFKTFRLVDGWCRSFIDIRLMMLDAEDEFCHVSQWQHMQQTFFAKHNIEYFYKDKNVLAILCLNSILYGVDFGANAMLYQMLELAIDIFQSILKGMRYLPLKKYFQLVTQQRNNEITNDSSYEKYVPDKSNDNDFMFNKDTDSLAVMIMSNLAMCHKVMKQYNIAQEIFEAALDITKRNYKQLDPSSKDYKHMISYQQMIQAQIDSLRTQLQSIPPAFETRRIVK